MSAIGTYNFYVPLIKKLTLDNLTFLWIVPLSHSKESLSLMSLELYCSNKKEIVFCYYRSARGHQEREWIGFDEASGTASAGEKTLMCPNLASLISGKQMKVQCVQLHALLTLR